MGLKRFWRSFRRDVWVGVCVGGRYEFTYLYVLLLEEVKMNFES